jgi:hypothetical protein
VTVVAGVHDQREPILVHITNLSTGKLNWFCLCTIRTKQLTRIRHWKTAPWDFN